MPEPQVATRPLGTSGVSLPVLSMGGHAFIWEPSPDAELGGRILRYLLDHGVTTFDTTYARERQAYRKSIESAGLAGKLEPIVWHMEHGQTEQSKDDVIEAFRIELDEIGVKKAKLAVFEASLN